MFDFVPQEPSSSSGRQTETAAGGTARARGASSGGTNKGGSQDSGEANQEGNQVGNQAVGLEEVGKRTKSLGLKVVVVVVGNLRSKEKRGDKQGMVDFKGSIDLLVLPLV